MCQFVVGDFGAGTVASASGVFRNHCVDNIRRQFLVRFHGNREITVTATGFNIKTAYFIGDYRLFLILGDDVFKREAVLILAGRRIFIDKSCLLRGECNPSGWTDFLDMKETQDGGNIRFIDIRPGVGLRLWVFEHVSVGFERTRLSFTRGEDVVKPQVLHPVHNRRILEHE